MNERIKQLAEQAGCDWWEGRAQRDMTQCQDELEKFAELIVKECAVFVENDDYRGITLADRLKRHFGVEY
jgi:hypothetical protein